LIESKDDAEGESKTSAYLAENNEVVLFGPAIRINKLFIRIDVLIKCHNSINLIEVMAKFYNSIIS
jgi:hypothetical protein